jgi:hypothetical protein
LSNELSTRYSAGLTMRPNKLFILLLILLEVVTVFCLGILSNQISNLFTLPAPEVGYEKWTPSTAAFSMLIGGIHDGEVTPPSLHE